MKVKLEKALITTDGEVKEVEFDFNKMKGSDLIAAEKEVRAMGDQTPSVSIHEFSGYCCSQADWCTGRGHIRFACDRF